MALASGTRLGPYELTGALGAGGMGEVYRARDTRLDRTVAVKVLPTHLSSDPEVKQRFEREARAISALSHPHICHLYDVGSQSGTDFIVMEYLEGETVANRLQKGALPLNQVLKIGIEIADALDRAHRQGIVHRDLKPGNIMLTKSGAKLMDFGLAKGLSVSTAGPMNSRLSEATITIAGHAQQPVTVEGTLVGTFQYMAPEQIEGKEADARSDIFAFGASVYEMVTGKRAFHGKSQLNVVSAILEKDPVPISTLQPLVPPMLEHVVSRALSKDPDQRWQSAADIRGELAWIVEQEMQRRDKRGSQWTERQRPPWTWLAVAIAIFLFGSLWLLKPKPKLELIRANISVPDRNSFVIAQDDSSGPAVISPGGHYLAFVAADEAGEGRQIWIRDLAQSTSSQIPGTDDATYPFWSPDERSVGFFADGKLKRIGIGGGPVLSLCDVQRDARGGSWAANGAIVYAAGPETPISTVSERGGTPRTVTQLESFHTTNRWPVFLPDGRHFLYLASNHQAPEASEHNGIYVGSTDGDGSRFLLPANSSVALASGYLLFLRNDALMAQPFDGARAKMVGEPLPLGIKVHRNPGTWRANFDASARLLVYYPATGEMGSQLVWVDRTGKAITHLAERELVDSMSLSLDGRHLAAALGDPGAQIWIYDTARGTRTRLTFEKGGAGPVWSRDGKRIAFAERHVGAFDIYVKNADGSGPEQLVFASAEDKTVWDWSPDGRSLLISAGRPSGLWMVPVDGKNKPEPLLQRPYPVWRGVFSPDGHWLTYESSEVGRTEIYATRFPSLIGQWQVSEGGGQNPQWRGDGKALYYVTPDTALAEASLSFTTDGLEVHDVKRLFKGIGSASISPLRSSAFVATSDGRRFLITKTVDKFTTLNLVVNWTTSINK
jgi:eukaryotic-like serine/threonine-protein kinase